MIIVQSAPFLTLIKTLFGPAQPVPNFLFYSGVEPTAPGTSGGSPIDPDNPGTQLPTTTVPLEVE